jgi:hypothetical protein
VPEFTHWGAGDRCRVVEHDDATGQPKPGGRVLPATVDYTDRHGFVFADIPGLGRAIAFRVDTGRALGSNSGWRLVKACQCAIDGGPGIVIPPACPVHGIPCESCGGIESCKEDCNGEAADYRTVDLIADRYGKLVKVASAGAEVVIIPPPECGALFFGAEQRERFAEAVARAATPGQVSG